MGRRTINVGVIEYGTAEGLPTFAEMRMYEGTKARNAETDVKHRWDGHAWIPGWDSGPGGGGGVPEPASDGIWSRNKVGAAHTWIKGVSSEGSAKPVEKIWAGTQAQYDAVGVKDDKTLYNIEETTGQYQNGVFELEGDNPTMKMLIDNAGTAASMQVIDKSTGHMTALMEYDKISKSFSFDLFDPNTGVSKATFQVKQDGKGYIGGQEIQTGTLKLDRPEVVSPYTATPTKAELVTAFKLLPEYVSADAAGKLAFWKEGHDFYVKDSPQTKLLLVKYRGLPASTEASPGNYFFEKMAKAN